MVFHVKGMVLAGWFYIIRRHITVETPLDKRNLERRDRIFVRTTRVKNHPNRQPRRGLFFFFSSAFFFASGAPKILLLILALLLFPVFVENRIAKRGEGRTRDKGGEERLSLFFRYFLRIVLETKKKKKKKKKNFRTGRKDRSSRSLDISICYRGPTGIGETDFKSEKMGSNATKAFTRLALPTTGSFKANCPQRGCKLPLSADVYAHALSSNPGLLRAC